MKNLIWFIAVVLLSTATSPRMAVAQAVDGSHIKPPAFLKADEQRPARYPEQGSVAVLSLRIEAVRGTAKDVEVKSVKIVRSAAPKVFARSAGDWEVRIKGDQPASYRILNPLTDIEVENERGAASPYSRVLPTGLVDWEVVVPLYKDGRSLGARTIEIVDLAGNQPVVSVDLKSQRQ